MVEDERPETVEAVVGRSLCGKALFPLGSRGGWARAIWASVAIFSSSQWSSHLTIIGRTDAVVASMASGSHVGSASSFLNQAEYFSIPGHAGSTKNIK